MESEGTNIFFFHFFRNILLPIKENIVDFDMRDVMRKFKTVRKVSREDIII